MRKAKVCGPCVMCLLCDWSDPYFTFDVQISVHAADVKTVLRVYSIEVAAEKKEDLIEEPIVKRLRKVRPPLYLVFVHSYLSSFRPAGRATMAFDLYFKFRARIGVFFGWISIHGCCNCYLFILFTNYRITSQSHLGSRVIPCRIRCADYNIAARIQKHPGIRSAFVAGILFWGKFRQRLNSILLQSHAHPVIHFSCLQLLLVEIDRRCIPLIWRSYGLIAIVPQHTRDDVP